jgi:hypothetical protein
MVFSEPGGASNLGAASEAYRNLVNALCNLFSSIRFSCRFHFRRRHYHKVIIVIYMPYLEARMNTDFKGDLNVELSRYATGRRESLTA